MPYKDPEKLKEYYNVDHNHTTGKTRQLLCYKCNIGIGMLREDTSILLRAIDYLNKWNNNL